MASATDRAFSSSTLGYRTVQSILVFGASIGWAGLTVSALRTSGRSGRRFRAQADDIPRRCVACVLKLRCMPNQATRKISRSKYEKEKAKPTAFFKCISSEWTSSKVQNSQPNSRDATAQFPSAPGSLPRRYIRAVLKTGVSSRAPHSCVRGPALSGTSMVIVSPNTLAAC